MRTIEELPPVALSCASAYTSTRIRLGAVAHCTSIGASSGRSISERVPLAPSLALGSSFHFAVFFCPLSAD